ncbi:MAG: glycosyltransferase, partial [Pseudoxanthomonas sp.]
MRNKSDDIVFTKTAWSGEPTVRVAVLVPCFNEAATIGNLVRGLRRALPRAAIHVFDNASTDETAECARAAGATVSTVLLRGKGNVTRRMFADVEADVYVMLDGDGTYDPADAPRLVRALIDDNLDMVIGRRIDDGAQVYRPGHRFGNRLLTGSVCALFGGQIQDMLTGYRVFSRRFAKSFPALSSGFEIETELTIHALELRMPFTELPVAYGTRHEESSSKLSTIGDGVRIFRTIGKLYISERPLHFFSIVSLVLAVASLLAAVPLALTFLESGLVPRLPTAVLVTGVMLTAILLFVCGVVLHSVTLGRQEAKRLRYLAVPGVRHA